MKFIIISEFGELLDLAHHLQDVEKKEVLFYVQDHDYANIGEGIVPKMKKWDWLDLIGQGHIWVIDGCADGQLQDWLRSKGEAVFGGSADGDDLENDRQLNQDWFAAAGFKEVESHNFKKISDAVDFIEKNTDRRWIMKQNGQAPKSLNHMGKFDGNEDMLYHLQELERAWNEAQYGPVDFDLMEVVEGLEVAASVFFNGKDFCTDENNKVVGFLNFEEKKEANGATGETTGEMGTTYLGCNEDNKLFNDIIMRPKLLEVLRGAKFRGVFDVNCIQTENGIVALEPTMRPGIPASSYEFLEGLDMSTADMLEIVAKGEERPIKVKMGEGMVMCIVAKPYPVETDVDDGSTSIGERLWILKDGKPAADFDREQLKHIHLENFQKKENAETGEMEYCVASKNGYLLTVTGTGDSIKDTREKLIEYIKQNLYIPGMKYRTDIGSRVEEHYGIDEKSKLEKEMDEMKVAHEKEKQGMKDAFASEMNDIKEAIKDTLYGDALE